MSIWDDELSHRGRLLMSVVLGKRIDDDEILFVALILMFGEPPRRIFNDTDDTWKRMSGNELEASLKFMVDAKEYSLAVKDMMGELGHDPHQGLFTSYMHWCKEEWNGHVS